MPSLRLGLPVAKSKKAILQRYQKRPDYFFTEQLDVKPENLWDRMVEIMYSVRDHRKTSVHAGHGVSKSYTAARIALWFLYCFPPATVITSASSFHQLKNVLWREIRDGWDNARVPMGGDFTTLKIDMQPEHGMKWFMIGVSTKPDTVTREATKFQGFHNENILVIFDEAAGIHTKIWDAAESLMTDENPRWLAIGNPTSVWGEFVNLDKSWHQIRIASTDTPNFKKGKVVIPGLAGREFERAYREKYGKDSNRYRIRISGLKPTYLEGTIYGKLMADVEARGRVTSIPDNPGLVHTAWDIGVSDSTAIWFFRMVGLEVHILGYYENSGEALTHYAAELEVRRKENKWLWGRHFGPHDINNRSISTNRTYKETAFKLGIDFQTVSRITLVDGIELARQVIPRCWFDSTHCTIGLKALTEYRWKQNVRMSTDDVPVFSNTPEHDWSSHGADAFRYLSIAIEQLVGGRVMTVHQANELEQRHARPS